MWRIARARARVWAHANVMALDGGGVGQRAEELGVALVIGTTAKDFEWRAAVKESSKKVRACLRAIDQTARVRRMRVCGESAGLRGECGARSRIPAQAQPHLWLPGFVGSWGAGSLARWPDGLNLIYSRQQVPMIHAQNFSLGVNLMFKFSGAARLVPRAHAACMPACTLAAVSMPPYRRSGAFDAPLCCRRCTACPSVLSCFRVGAIACRPRRAGSRGLTTWLTGGAWHTCVCMCVQR